MTNARTQRTDPHRPSMIIPAHYAVRMWYSLAHESDGWPQPPINVDRVVDITRETKAAGKDVFGSLGKCGVCGAHYLHGVLFLHEPTGDLVHMGEDCASKYEAMVDWSAIELERDRVHRATAKAIQRAANERDRAAFLGRSEHAGLDVVLAAGTQPASELGIAESDYRMLGAHAILADLAHKFTRFCELSEKQVALAIRLYAQITTPPAERPADVKIPAPVGQGRITFAGEIVSAKLHVSEQWGASWKCTIKVTRESDGAIWLAWGSVPGDLMERVGMTETVRNARNYAHRDSGESWERTVRGELRGLHVEVTATLEGSTSRACGGCEGAGSIQGFPCRTCKGKGSTGGDLSFAFMKRPSMRVLGMVDHPVRPPAPRGKRAKKAATESSSASGVLGDERALAREGEI